jgi:light-regulated signal transduction histidine kinase (bacteriophytochrome)
MQRRSGATEAEALRAELDRWLFAAGHDLAEPARTARSFLELVERRHGASLALDAREYVGFAMDAARRLEVMLAGLLEVARVAAEPSPAADVDLQPVIEAAARGLRPQLDATGGRIEIGTLPTVTGSAQLWRRLFAILIENAITYRSAAPPVVQISASPGRITVADNGIGIARPFFARVFEPFQRLHTRDAIPGCGMGLTVARRIAEHHGCTLDVESGEPGGAVFVVGLPAA